MYYTIGTSILSAATMPLGLIMGKGKTRSTFVFPSVFTSVTAGLSTVSDVSVFYPKKTNTDAE